MAAHDLRQPARRRTWPRSTGFFTQLGLHASTRSSRDETGHLHGGQRAGVRDAAVAAVLRHLHPKQVADPAATTGAILAVSAGSRDEVDTLVDTRPRARRRGPPTSPQDEGFMYGRSFYDLDGHAWEVMWMDPTRAVHVELVHDPQHRPAARPEPPAGATLGADARHRRGGRRAVESAYDDVRPSRVAGRPGPALRRAGRQHPRPADLPRRRRASPTSWCCAAPRRLGQRRRRRAGRGGRRRGQVTVGACTEHALVDGPIHYLHALRRVAHDPGPGSRSCWPGCSTPTGTSAAR